MNKSIVVLYSIWTLVFSISCTHLTKTAEKIQVDAQEIVLMTYNVENLFDTKDDPGKDDEEYLPRSLKKSAYYQNLCFTKSSEYFRDECLGKDWSEKIFRRKVARLSDVITRVNGGRGPDVLVVEEVENINALKALAEAMPLQNYITVELIEGPDERGIDVGVISRLPKKSSKLHNVDFEAIKYSLKNKKTLLKERSESSNSFSLASEDVKDVEEAYLTRGILEVELELPDGKSLFVLGAHLPSQRSSTGYRRVVLEKLAQVKSSLPDKALVFAAGDFNISATEDAKERLFSEQIARDWKVSHKIGCETCTGTYYYHHKREWSFFDVFLFDEKLVQGVEGWKVDPKSIKVFNESLYQTSRFGSPARFGKGKQGVGVSDHWPLIAKIKKEEQQKISEVE